MADTASLPATTMVVVEQLDQIPAGAAPKHVALFDESGNPIELGGSDYELPAATTEQIGGVKKAAAVAAIASPDATTAASAETVSPAEFAAAVTLLNETKQKVNTLMANGTAAGWLS